MADMHPLVAASLVVYGQLDQKRARIHQAMTNMRLNNTPEGDPLYVRLQQENVVLMLKWHAAWLAYKSARDLAAAPETLADAEWEWELVGDCPEWERVGECSGEERD